MNKLQEIMAYKATEVEKVLHLEDKWKRAAVERNEFRSFENALRPEPGFLSLIAEVKRASPSAGLIASDFDPVQRAVNYEKAGANAISVLTDEKYFQGSLAFLSQIRAKVSLPLLRKDFIIHEVQIYESVIAGADAILLIVAGLEDDQFRRLLEVAHTYQLDVLVEVHDAEELERTLETETRILGVNNRNLKTFQVDLGTTEALASQVGEEVIFVSESGIKTREDAMRVHGAGADAILVGESLMRTDSLQQSVNELTCDFSPEESPTL